jgi:hypothetical protein
MDALTDTSIIPKHILGTLRIEQDDKFGERWFRYCQNKSGGSLVADSSVMYDGSALGAVTANGGGTTYATRASGSFLTDKVSVGDMIYVVDDAGAAGAAPEGEVSYVTGVTALRVDFLPALTAAIAASDTVSIIKKWALIAAAAKAGKRGAGIPMVDLADGYCGWVQSRGIYPSANVVAAGTALLEGDRLMHGAAILTPAATVANNAATTDDINEVVVATVLQPLTSDTVRRKAVVLLAMV